MKQFCALLLFILFSPAIFGQEDSTASKLTFTSDFRFRVEQDWNSRKADGTYRDDRTRFRYRLRFGMNYQYNKWASFGVKIRTGQANKQQDPQLTLGQGFKEFGTLPVGFEKAFFKAQHKGLVAWFGKNSFPFRKQNELFWSDNVCPEGIFLGYKFDFESRFIDQLSINAGHFIIEATGGSLDMDSYFQGVQLHSSHWEKRIEIFPAFYFFNKIADIPDGFQTTTIDYAIFHFGAKVELVKRIKLSLKGDYYNNFTDLSENTMIPSDLKDQNQGFSLGLGIGELKEKRDWQLKLTYAQLERFAAVDFLSQNDWARWDYSSAGSPDGRLTNFRGVEVFLGYAINKKMNLKARCFIVEQLIPSGAFKETGNRVRFDLNIGF